ncbi:hypothetical protein HDR70_06440 [bacterium]|nr:hypothetical protein [bacterium]
MYEVITDFSNSVWMAEKGRFPLMRHLFLGKLTSLICTESQVRQMEPVIKGIIEKLNKLYPLEEPLSFQVRDRKQINGSITIYIFRKGCKKVREKFFARLVFSKSDRQFKDVILEHVLGYVNTTISLNRELYDLPS